MEPFFIPVPVVCKGVINQYLKKSGLYEVHIFDSPMLDFNGSIYCELIYQPGGSTNFFPGDKVKVLIVFQFGGTKMRYEGNSPIDSGYILGLFDESRVLSVVTKHPVSGNEDDYTFVHPKTGAGVVTDSQGSTIISTGGSIRSVFKPFGHGSYENSHKTEAMNHHRVISDNSPFYTSKEHFGIYSGKDSDDKKTKTSPDDIYITYRRFVAQTKDLSKWVSSCEGTWNPWVGPNNNVEEVKNVNDILFTKIINAGDNRVTIEAGEEGDEFFVLRIDKLMMGERQVPKGGGATPAIGGNMFKLKISDKGAMEIRASGKGIPKTNMTGFTLEISEKGDLNIKASGVITFTHGDTDKDINSIVLDPAKGVDIKAMNGFRVNGKTLINESYLSFMTAHTADWGISAVGPVALSPAVVADLGVKTPMPMMARGLTTKQVGPPAAGVQVDKLSNSHSTVA